MKNAKILVVEDESIVAKDLCDLLIEAGYEMAGTAATASDAIMKAEIHHPDLILMDIMLGGDKNGVYAADQIRKKLGITSIFITAYADIELIKKASETQPYAYIVKPFNVKQVITCVKLVLYKECLEKELRQKIDEIKKAAGDEKNKLETEIKELEKKVDAHRKELMLFINSSKF